MAEDNKLSAGNKALPEIKNIVHIDENFDIQQG